MSKWIRGRNIESALHAQIDFYATSMNSQTSFEICIKATFLQIDNV